MSEVLPRPALDVERLTAHAVREGRLWHTIRVLAEAESANDEATAAALAGEAEGLVVAVENQTAGRGRHDRHWVSPARAGLTFSVLLRPTDVPQRRWGWLPLLVGSSVATAVAEATQIETRLKWPNDVLLGIRRKKFGGLLATVAGDAVVIGVGLNVTNTADELPIPEATSLLLEGAWTVDRTVLLDHVLDQIEHDYRQWRVCEGDPCASYLLDRYRSQCSTLGKEVTITLPGGGSVVGTAVDVAYSGALRVDGPQGRVTISAGDVQHVRPTDAPAGPATGTSAGPPAGPATGTSAGPPAGPATGPPGGSR